jgi:hypothetical protein
VATQILGTDHAVLLPNQTEDRPDAGHDEACDASIEIQEHEGNVFRGIFYAMLFNIFLLLTGAAGWALWQLMR